MPWTFYNASGQKLNSNAATVVTGGTDNAILRADGTGGVTSQGSAVTILDGGCLVVVATDKVVFDGGGNNDTYIYESAEDQLCFFTGNRRMMQIRGGNMFIGDSLGSSPTNNENSALTLMQGGADNQIFALKSSDVAHGMTDQMDTDAYFAIKKAVGGSGGAMFEAASQGCVVICGQLYGSVDCSTRSTSGKAHMQFKMYGRTGTGVTVKGTGSNAFAISHAGNMRFVVDVCGNVYYDGTTNASNWDEHCDVSLLTATRAITMPEDADFKHRFSSFIDEYACALEATGVVTLNRDTDNIPFVNTKALNGLIIDSIRQVHEKVIGLENQFKALQGGCP